ncbi:MAG: hypothetical protein MUO24_03830 [Desulfobacterales bacterium]|nr:hypothetical protein [Desulfobacterales bacterium]
MDFKASEISLHLRLKGLKRARCCPGFLEGPLHPIHLLVPFDGQIDKKEAEEMKKKERR